MNLSVAQDTKISHIFPPLHYINCTARPLLSTAKKLTKFKVTSK